MKLFKPYLCNHLLISVKILNNGKNKIIPVPYKGNGFEEQIEHFCECIEKGLIESPVVTREQTLFITRQMDEIRNITGVVYPQDN